MYRNFHLVKTHYEKGHDRIVNWGPHKSQGFTPRIKTKFRAQFPAEPDRYDVCEKGNVVITTKMSVAQLLRVQAPGHLAITAGSLLADTTWATCFKEPVALAQAKWSSDPKETGTSHGAGAHDPLVHDDVRGPYTIQENLATVYDTTKRNSWCTVICTCTCPGELTSYMSGCTCGAPVTLGHPCDHLRAHARKLGLDEHEIADHRLLASTLKNAYREAGTFGDVRIFVELCMYISCTAVCMHKGFEFFTCT